MLKPRAASHGHSKLNRWHLDLFWSLTVANVLLVLCFDSHVHALHMTCSWLHQAVHSIKMNTLRDNVTLLVRSDCV